MEPQIIILLVHQRAHDQAQAARRFSISAQNPRSPSNLRRHPQAFKPACLLRETARGEATGIKGSSYAAAAATLTYSPSILLSIPYYCLLSPYLYYTTAHPHYSHALTSSALASSTPLPFSAASALSCPPCLSTKISAATLGVTTPIISVSRPLLLLPLYNI